MAKNPDIFDWFGADEPNPIGKFKQPRSNDYKPGAGYPTSDIDKVGITVKGRWPAGTKMKPKMDMRGTGAATRGKKFFPED
jgi:hypothetical protein